MLHHRTPPRARDGAEAGSRRPCFTNLVFTVMLSPRRRDTASFDGGPLFSAVRLTHFAVFHQSGRTPLLPLYALFQFKAPEELTLRTL
nr:MAG TPA: hypothetical protein [Caudoviricetes sp.]